ncbi:HDOD domain-containing protein [Miltoncostaea oceani]|uniref:HDOD domain-containing protein n=1 Tax=Miltoncostaea oceani TaxID=2843216 RepID=UPI001C3E1A74|nr:HDOD domain-containing protein [Miltoncostaea oceani]
MSTTSPDTVTAPEAPRVTARAVAEAADRLAAPSPVVAGVLQLLDEGSAPVRLIGARVSQSPEVAAQVLRLGNSALFSEPVDTIERAIVRIGERTLRGLLLAATTYRLLEGPLTAYGYPRLYLLRHCGEVAVMAQSLARLGPAALASQVYLAGLLHDLGKPILATIAEDRGMDVGEEVVTSVARERELFGTDHTRVAAWIARRWGLPEDLCLAMERHHDAAPPAEAVARPVWLADIAVRASGGDEEAIARLPLAAAECGLAPDALETLLMSSPDTDGPRRPPGLTDREVQVLRLLARGSAAKQVAHELGCSASTVHNHLHHVYRKLGVSGQSQALLLAREKGWV